MTKTTTAVEKTFEDLRSEVSVAQMQAMADLTAEEFDARMTFEHRERPGNEKIQEKLKSAKTRMTSLGIAGVMVAAKISPDFVNRSVTEGRRYNVYAFEKFNDLAGGLVSGSFKNAVNLAILKSLYAFSAAAQPFTGLAALAACSDKVKVEKGMSAHLTRHTVSAATAPTQTSSTMNALQTLGIVVNKGSNKFPLWELTETPVTARVKEILKVA
jgi:hypothetical protein